MTIEKENHKELTADELHEQLKMVKRSLHGMMNGVVSSSMRNKGLNYKINFGVELPRLQEFAERLPHTYQMAAALWKERIRECRLLAPMLMPKEEFSADLAEIWIEQLQYTEEADALVFYLLHFMPYASEAAYQWIADERTMWRYVGYNVMARLFEDGLKPNKKDIDEFLDHCKTDLHDLEVQKAAYNALKKFMRQGLMQERLGEKLLY